MARLTIKEIIVAAGGGVALADRFDMTPAGVSVWRNNGIPSKYWPELARYANERGRADITVERIRNADSWVRAARR